MNSILKYKWWRAMAIMFYCLVSISTNAITPHVSAGYLAGNLIYPNQVNRIYALNTQPLLWYGSDPQSQSARRQFMDAIENAQLHGIDREKYHYSDLKKEPDMRDSFGTLKQDLLFTDAVVAFSKDMYQGVNIDMWLKNDEVSRKNATNDDSYLVSGIAKATDSAKAAEFLASLEPKSADYATLKKEMAKQLEAGNKQAVKQLGVSLNFLRWIDHFKFDKYIVVNIPAAKLRYFEKGDEQLQMKVVVGKPTTKTPRFTTYCYQIISYPYWNVPPSIASKELIPKFKSDPSKMEEMNIKCVNKNGRVVDCNIESANQWSFPYTFRQSTGCQNSLGVLKFDLTDPFDVYMHDTNNKTAFEKASRFLSHGCIRLEKPIELGNILLNNRLDEGLLRSCIFEHEPIYTKLDKPVPVFVVYLTAAANDDKVSYLKDVYGLF